MATTTYPVLVDPPWLRQTDVTSELVDQHDAAIFEVTKAMVGAMAIYRERHHGR